MRTRNKESSITGHWHLELATSSVMHDSKVILYLAGCHSDLRVPPKSGHRS